MYKANFRQYWPQHMAHMAVGLLIGLAGLLGLPLAILVASRQALEYQAIHDTGYIDLAYHVGAAALGLAIHVALLVVVALTLL